MDSLIYFNAPSVNKDSLTLSSLASLKPGVQTTSYVKIYAISTSLVLGSTSPAARDET